MLEHEGKNRRLKSTAGELTGIKIDEGGNAHGQVEVSSYAEMWELNQLKYMGGLVKGNPVITEDIEEINI